MRRRIRGDLRGKRMGCNSYFNSAMFTNACMEISKSKRYNRISQFSLGFSFREDGSFGYKAYSMTHIFYLDKDTFACRGSEPFVSDAMYYFANYP